MGQESCKSRQRCSVTVARSQASLLGPDGPCKGVGSPNGWYAVPQQPGICMNRPALETIPPWVRNPANHGKGVLSLLHGHGRPCWALMDPAKVSAVPMDGTQCLNSLESFDLSYGAIAATVRSQSQRDRGHSAIGYRVPGAIAVTARSRSRRNRGHSANAVTASSRSWRDRGPGTGQVQPPPTPPARSPASTRRHAIGPLQGPTPPSGSAARRPTPGRSRTPDGGPQSADDEVVEASERQPMGSLFPPVQPLSPPPSPPLTLLPPSLPPSLPHSPPPPPPPSLPPSFPLRLPLPRALSLLLCFGCMRGAVCGVWRA